MLRHYVLEFPDYYHYDIMLIVFGFLIGFGTMSGITLSNIIRTKNNPKRESTMNFMVGLAISIPLIVLVIGLALFVGLASAWQFSIGFFLAAIFPALFVILFELTTKNKFFIREAKDEPQKDRKLVAVAA
jgi:MFS family permease